VLRKGGSQRLRVSEASRAVSISTRTMPSAATTTVLSEEKASGRMTMAPDDEACSDTVKQRDDRAETERCRQHQPEPIPAVPAKQDEHLRGEGEERAIADIRPARHGKGDRIAEGERRIERGHGRGIGDLLEEIGHGGSRFPALSRTPPGRALPVLLDPYGIITGKNTFTS
jgi:hypothetical protein